MTKSAVFILVLAGCLSFFTFQNCAVQPEALNQGQGNPLMIDDIDNYQTLSHSDGSYHGPQLSLGSGELQLDLPSGRLTIKAKGITDCQLDRSRLAELSEIIGDGRVCEPAPLPPGTPICMAMRVIQTRLSGSSGELPLYGEVCNNGSFLCNGRLEDLETYLRSLLRNPPSYCNN